MTTIRIKLSYAIVSWEKKFSSISSILIPADKLVRRLEANIWKYYCILCTLHTNLFSICFRSQNKKLLKRMADKLWSTTNFITDLNHFMQLLLIPSPLCNYTRYLDRANSAKSSTLRYTTLRYTRAPHRRGTFLLISKWSSVLFSKNPVLICVITSAKYGLQRAGQFHATLINLRPLEIQLDLERSRYLT